MVTALWDICCTRQSSIQARKRANNQLTCTASHPSPRRSPENERDPVNRNLDVTRQSNVYIVQVTHFGYDCGNTACTQSRSTGSNQYREPLKELPLFNVRAVSRPVSVSARKQSSQIQRRTPRQRSVCTQQSDEPRVPIPYNFNPLT